VSVCGLQGTQDGHERVSFLSRVKAPC